MPSKKSKNAKRVKSKTAQVKFEGRATVTANAKVGRFREAARAVHVVPLGDSWEFFRIGSKPARFASKDNAISAARKAAEANHAKVLIHDQGHAKKLR